MMEKYRHFRDAEKRLYPHLFLYKFLFMSGMKMVYWATFITKGTRLAAYLIFPFFGGSMDTCLGLTVCLNMKWPFWCHIRNNSTIASSQSWLQHLWHDNVLSAKHARVLAVHEQCEAGKYLKCRLKTCHQLIYFTLPSFLWQGRSALLARWYMLKWKSSFIYAPTNCLCCCTLRRAQRRHSPLLFTRIVVQIVFRKSFGICF